MKRSSAIRAPLLGIALFGCLTGVAHAGDTSLAATGDAQALQLPQTDNTASAATAQADAAPLMLAQESNVTSPDVPVPLTPADAPHDVFIPPPSWNDTYLGYRVGSDFYYPGVRTASGAPAKITQNIGSLTSTGGFKYGSYAFNVDYLVSSMANPEAGPTNAYGYPTPGSGGAQEVYSVGRVEFSASKIFGRSFSYGFIRDFGLTTGYEFGVKDDAFAERARMLVFGPTVEFAVPHGFWNVTVGVRKETNHDGITNVEVNFNPALHIESSWLYPFRVGPVPLVFKGFVSVTGPKGKDGAGVGTTTEILSRVSLLADVGSFAGHPRTFYAGVGYEYWHNMYGTNPGEQPGTTQTSCPMLEAEIHF